MMRKVIATGKGGAGKTTVLSALAVMMAREGRRVIVFDTDPSMNLALTFGIPYESMSTITEDKGHIAHDLEEQGLREKGMDIILEHSSVTSDGIRIVVMGAILQGGTGCLCSAISIVKLLLSFVEESGDYDIAIIDSQAGPEVLGRGLASSFDCNLVVTEPTAKSSEVSRQVKKLAEDLGVKDTVLAVNKVSDDGDVGFTAQMVGVPPYRAVGIRDDPNVMRADRDGDLLADAYPDTPAVVDLVRLKEALDASMGW